MHQRLYFGLMCPCLFNESIESGGEFLWVFLSQGVRQFQNPSRQDLQVLTCFGIVWPHADCFAEPICRLVEVLQCLLRFSLQRRIRSIYFDPTEVVERTETQLTVRSRFTSCMVQVTLGAIGIGVNERECLIVDGPWRQGVVERVVGRGRWLVAVLGVWWLR